MNKVLFSLHVACLSLLVLTICLTGCRVVSPPPAPRLPTIPWDRPGAWTTNANERSAASAAMAVEDGRTALRVDYKLRDDTHGYAEFIHEFSRESEAPLIPLEFTVKARGTGGLEIKFIDDDGSVFGRKLPLDGEFQDWTRVVLDMSSVEYWWGGANGSFERFAKLMLVPSGQGAHGTIWFTGIGPAPEGTPSTLPPAGPVLDPDRERPGFGFRQRRDAELAPEDPLVLEWLKHIQDTTTPARNLLGTLEDTNIQTFNNALAAAAFLVKGERERAERILDFFASATDRSNTEQFRQNFFYNGEARGFFQNAHPVIRDGVVSYHADKASDRWMGDMVWLMYAYLYYDKLYGAGRYDEIEKLMMDLIVSWWKESPDGKTGYVQHGWRKGDVRLHEDDGHHEGNIDCYALFRLLGMNDHASKVRAWLESQLHGKNLPLDLYTWRALAYAPEGADLLDVCDFDLRFRKTVEFRGRTVVGVYHSPDITISNVWVDGVGHIACAYFAVGNPARGNFYANQMDAMIVDRELNGRRLRAVPYVLNEQGGFGGMNTGAGSVSPSAWYIFAKNRFNPMLIETAAAE